MKEFIDKTSTQIGTPINRISMMAVQGFENNTIQFMDDGTIVQTNGDGETLTTTFNKDGRITQVFVGEKTISKTTLFNADGSISEVVS